MLMNLSLCMNLDRTWEFGSEFELLPTCQSVGILYIKSVDP